MPPLRERIQRVRSIGQPQRRRGGLARHHPQGAQDVEHSLDAGRDERPLEPAGAPRLVDDRRHPRRHGRAAQRPLGTGAGDDQRAAEGRRQLRHGRIGEIGADLRIVGALAAGRVQVEPEVALADHLAEEDVGEAGGERPLAAAGEGAVEVAPVGEAAVLVQEAGDVDDRHRDQRPLRGR